MNPKIKYAAVDEARTHWRLIVQFEGAGAALMITPKDTMADVAAKLDAMAAHFRGVAAGTRNPDAAPDDLKARGGTLGELERRLRYVAEQITQVTDRRAANPWKIDALERGLTQLDLCQHDVRFLRECAEKQIQAAMTPEALEALPICPGFLIDELGRRTNAGDYLGGALHYRETDFACIHDTQGVAWATGADLKTGETKQIRVHRFQ